MDGNPMAWRATILGLQSLPRKQWFYISRAKQKCFLGAVLTSEEEQWKEKAQDQGK
jgi:hypothetical protein